MTPSPGPGTPRVFDEGGDDASAGETTVRRPRVPAPPDPVALADTDHADDTVIVRRDTRRRRAAGADPHPDPSEPGDIAAGAVAAYPSRIAAPVRGSRKGQASATSRDRAEVGEGGAGDAIPDASGIRRTLRARARRRLAALIATIVALVVVLLTALVALVFAVGV